MINFNFSRFDRSTTRAVNPANLISVEGAPLVVDNSVDNGVKVSVGGASEIWSGVSISQQNTITQSAFVDLLTASTGATPTTNTTYPLAASTAVYVYDTTSSSALAIVTSAPASGQVEVAAGSTLLTFNTAQAGHNVTVYYRYNTTAAQSQGLQGTILPGGDSGAILNVVGVLIAGDIYTDQWDASVSWAANPVAVKLSAAGLFTVGGSGITVPGRVIHAPTSDDPFLGLSVYNG